MLKQRHATKTRLSNFDLKKKSSLEKYLNILTKDTGNDGDALVQSRIFELQFASGGTLNYL